MKKQIFAFFTQKCFVFKNALKRKSSERAHFKSVKIRLKFNNLFVTRNKNIKLHFYKWWVGWGDKLKDTKRSFHPGGRIKMTRVGQSFNQ